MLTCPHSGPKGPAVAPPAGASSLAAGGAVIGWRAEVEVEAEVAVDELAVQGISVIVESLGERAGDGEGEETEVVGVKAAGGGAREAVGGAVMEARAADTAVELAEEADDARVRAAQRLGDEEDDAVAFGERVGVEAIVRGDKAFACGVLERALAGEETAIYEVPLCAKGGACVEVLLNATPRRDASRGRWWAWSGSGRT